MPWIGANPREIMEPASADGINALPNDVLIVEDDPIIALDFEDTLLGFGVKAVRTAGSVARALEMIADRAPDFALLDVGLVREKSFAIAERLDSLKIPFVFVTGYGADVRVPKALADKPRLPKPCSTDALKAALKRRLDDSDNG
jgi:CheY-like chemotaxis protein